MTSHLHPAAPTARSRAMIVTLRAKVADLHERNRELGRELKRRDVVAVRLIRSEGRCQGLLTDSRRLQGRLRGMSRRMLTVQEEDRKKISRELHDVIIQTLTGITLLLEPLKIQARQASTTLDRTISRTQSLVAKSVAIVHRFARDLRPATLDHLGLIPALETFTQELGWRTGLKVAITLSPEVETLPLAARTVLFRVAQEALTNAARHAKATSIIVTLQRLDDAFYLRIHDDGRAFKVQDPGQGSGGKHLGLLSMHERMTLAGGRLEVASQAGHGTTISAWLPIGKPPRPPKRKS